MEKHWVSALLLVALAFSAVACERDDTRRTTPRDIEPTPPPGDTTPRQMQGEDIPQEPPMAGQDFVWLRKNHREVMDKAKEENMPVLHIEIQPAQAPQSQQMQDEPQPPEPTPGEEPPLPEPGMQDQDLSKLEKNSLDFALLVVLNDPKIRSKLDSFSTMIVDRTISYEGEQPNVQAGPTKVQFVVFNPEQQVIARVDDISADALSSALDRATQGDEGQGEAGPEIPEKEITWVRKSYGEAVASADKSVVLIAVQPGDPQAQTFRSDVLKNAELMERLNDYTVVMTYSGPSAAALPGDIKERARAGTSTILILDKDSKLIESVDGLNAEQLMTKLDAHKEHQ